MLLGDGEQIRCFTNIYDVADAIARFSLEGKAENQIFNIGNPEPITVKELASEIVSVAKGYRLLPADYALAFQHQAIYQDDVRKRIPDVAKIRKAFGWEAKIKVRQSIDAYIKRKFTIT